MTKLVSPPESFLGLCSRLELHSGIPYVEDWSAASDFIELIVDHLMTGCPDVILECGSGLSTLMLARACQQIDQGRIISLESGSEYAINTREAIKSYGLDQYVTVIHAPLVDHQYDGGCYQWYALDDLPADYIDMLIIDGPPGVIQKYSRYPALPLLNKHLSPGCNIFMDDAGRADELEIVELWKETYSGIHAEYIEVERGCAKLTMPL